MLFGSRYRETMGMKAQVLSPRRCEKDTTRRSMGGAIHRTLRGICHEPFCGGCFRDVTTAHCIQLLPYLHNHRPATQPRRSSTLPFHPGQAGFNFTLALLVIRLHVHPIFRQQGIMAPINRLKCLALLAAISTDVGEY